MQLDFLKEVQIDFLREGLYILPEETPQQRFQEIVEKVREYENRYSEGLADRLSYMLDKNILSLSTPVLSNFGRKVNKNRKSQDLPASCYIVTVGDSVVDIYNSIGQVAIASKLGGGVGSDFQLVSQKGTKLDEGFYSNSKLDWIEDSVGAGQKVSQGCYDDQTELLTIDGWKFFKDVVKDTTLKVAQVLDNEEIEFVLPLEYFEYDVSEELLSFKDSKNIDLLVTKNHNMVYKQERKSISNGKYKREVKDAFYIKSAENCPLHRDIKYLHSGFSKNGEGLTFKERLLIALQADGSKIKKYKKSIRFRFSKVRKFERLKWILDNLNLEYTENYYESDCTYNVYINVGEELPKTLDWVNLDNKSQQWCEEFINEVLRWDGSFHTKTSGAYTSIVEINVDKIQQICAISGYKSYKKVNYRHSEPNKSTIFELHLSKGNYFGVEKLKKQEIHYEGKVYCVEVPTSRLIVRRNGRTIVCGNSKRRGYNTPFISIEDNDFYGLMERIDKTNPNKTDRLINNTIGIILPIGFRDKLKIDKESQKRYLKVLEARKKTGKVYMLDTDNCMKNNSPVYNKLGCKSWTTNICTEYINPLFPDLTSICVISALNAIYWDIITPQMIKDAFMFLDIVNEEYVLLSKGIPFLEKAHNGAKKKRDIGLGLIGFAELLQMKGFAYGDMYSRKLNKEIFSTIRKYGEEVTYEMGEKLGSPEYCKKVGMVRRNCSLMMIAPNKSTSFISGATSGGIEPFMSNMFLKSLAKIQYIWKNPHLKKVLELKGKDTVEVWNSIQDNNGSVQHLDFLSNQDKEVFKTFTEVSPKDIIDLASDRQEFIDMGQSLNLVFRKNYTMKDIYEIHKYAWEKGIKTLYYAYNSAHAALEKDGESWDSCVSCAD
jgi:ribonucleoside-diphosphate reductase alpha chain